MSRVAKNPITLPTGVEFKLDNDVVTIKGPKGQLSHKLHPFVSVTKEDAVLSIMSKVSGKLSRAQVAKKDAVNSIMGTTRALVNNMVVGVTKGFVKKLALVGVGYRAQLKGNKLDLSLGFSHPVEYALPEGITAKMPTQTEIEIEGANKQLVGQVAAKIRALRPPEPYKGKGVRYADETVSLKETKKK